METLTDIINRNSSDKGSTFGQCHGYAAIYDEYFSPVRNHPIRLLEIGICDPRKHGASLLAWQEYFSRAKIFGIDIIPAQQFNNARIQTFQGDQSSRSDLGRFIQLYGGDFDFVVDDGSHQDAHQQISFGFLFQYLKLGGIYFIEDLHVSPRTVSLFKSIKDGSWTGGSKQFDNWLASECCNVKSTIQNVEFFCSDKLVAIWKKQRE